jgi:hypothetical protein
MATNNPGNINNWVENGVVVGGASDTFAVTAAGSTGQVLQGNTGTTPSFSTATYPSTATGTGKLLRADGTNWVVTTATYPNTAGSSGNVLTSDGTNWVSQAISGGVTSVSGTANRITSTGGATPVIDISASYVGQSSITTLGTVGTGTWQGSVVGGTYGGTGVNNGASTVTLGGSLTTSGAFASTFTMTGVTGVTFPTSGTLATTSQLTSGTVTNVSGTTNQVSVATGTTTPVISLVGPYTPATYTAHGVLFGAGTSSIGATTAGSTGQIIQSQGSGADPTWTTATFPATATGTGKVLVADGTNWVASTPTFPNASAASGKFIRSDGTNWVASTPTLPTSAGTSGKVLQSNGTNYVESTPTYPSASGTSRTILVSDGTNNVYSTETYATPGTSGNVMTSNGTNWTSATPPWTLLQTQTPSAVASITFTSSLITSTYQTYMLIFNSIVSAAGSTINLTISTDNGGSYLNSGYHSGCMFNAYNANTWTNQNSTTAFQLLTGLSSTNETAGKLFFYGAGQSKQFCLEGDFSVANTYWQKCHGSNTGTTAINNIKIAITASTFSGTVSLYGLKQ